MSLLARLFNFQASTPAVADDVDAELNQILNAINGTSTDKNLVTRYSHASDPPYAFDQLGAGLIAVWRQGGADKAKVNNSGQIETVHQFKSTLVTGTKPIEVVSTTKCDNLNADLLDGLDSAAFAQLATHKAAFSVGWFYFNLPGAVETTESVGRFIVPSGTEIQIIDITAVWAAGADSGASNIFTIKRRNSSGTLQTDVGTIDVNTPAQNALHVVTLGAPLTLSAGDQIYPLFTTRNTASEQLVTISVRGKQKLTT